MKPRISIVVPSYNQAQFLKQTLQSLLDQRDDALEIIVVDGGSTDGSVEIIKRHADRLTWWVSEKDSGQSHALNKGFAQASGEWLGWLNSDDLLLPGSLQTLRNHIEVNPEKEWWIGGGYFIDDYGRRFRDYAPPVGLERPQQLDDWSTFWFAQPSTFFRRDLYDRAAGLIREDLHYSMDLDLWLRLLKHAAPGFIHADISVYRHHVAGKTHALSEMGEAEIVKVLAEHIGMDQAMVRVANLARERNALRDAIKSIESKMGVGLKLYRWARSIKAGWRT